MKFDQRLFRTALGRFATGICVVTGWNRSGQAFGLTVNSFSSLSLDPPLVLWNLGRDSDTFDDFADVEHFAINILRDSQQAASVRFSRRHQHELLADEYREGSSGIPVLKDALAVIECTVEARHDGGDHVIQVGRVTDLEHCDEGGPLLFFAGQYRQLDP